MGGRIALDFEVEAVAEDTVGKGGGWRVGLEAPADDAGLGCASHIAGVLADGVGEGLGGAGHHVGDAVR